MNAARPFRRAWLRGEGAAGRAPTSLTAEAQATSGCWPSLGRLEHAPGELSRREAKGPRQMRPHSQRQGGLAGWGGPLPSGVATGQRAEDTHSRGQPPAPLMPRPGPWPGVVSEWAPCRPACWPRLSTEGSGAPWRGQGGMEGWASQGPKGTSVQTVILRRQRSQCTAEVQTRRELWDFF